jgi:methylmalonyl-CoA/ethylmalonyl-CoA epimerase
MGSFDPVGEAGVLALDHIAFGVRSIAATCIAIAERLGGVPYQSGPGVGFRGAQWTLPGDGRVEAIEPDGGFDGFLHRFLATRPPRLHHVTFKVTDIDASAAAVAAAGLSVVGFNAALASWKEMFLHPKEAQGIVVQLAESHPEIGDDGWTSDWPYPRPEPRAHATKVLGLRLSARSAESARFLWQRLLGGRPTSAVDGASLAFTWPESPLRISVEVAEDAPEGPVGIEVLAEHHAGRVERIDELDCSIIEVQR